MKKVDLTKQFAFRLREAMLAAGFNSHRSTSGVCTHKLAEITGYSLQICRKYLRGDAMPEPTKIIDIAYILKVAPGWLLFGESHNDSPISNEQLTIDKRLIHYIFTRIKNLYTATNNQDDSIANFLMELLSDLSQINTTEEQSKRIIDLTLSSVRYFSMERS